MTLTGNPFLVRVNFDFPPNDPLILLQEWLIEADKLGVSEPRSMILSTVNSLAQPSSRVVLIKESNTKGVIFCSSQTSAKGKDLDHNPWAAGTLWWRETVQQINFQGIVYALSNEKSDACFYERPKEAQAVSASSVQSAPLANEQELKNKIATLMNQPETIIRPKTWHAYQLTIESIEFWYGSKDRFHHRLRYDLIDGSWQHKKLQP